MAAAFFEKYSGDDYDKYQPIRVEHYHFYHELASDFIPFNELDDFRFLDIGCGTGNFLTHILSTYPNSTALAFDYSQEMLNRASQKNAAHQGRVAFRQRDLNEGLPRDIGTFDLVSAFSAIHHLTDENKKKIFSQIFKCLAPKGWFFIIDAMTTPFENTVYRLGRQRNERRAQERMERSGFDLSEYERVEGLKVQGTEDSPDRDRLARLGAQLDWLRETGFGSVDHIWHFWMEHFIIARK